MNYFFKHKFQHTCNVNKFWLTNQAKPTHRNRRMERKGRTKAMSRNKEESIGIRKIQPNVANGEHMFFIRGCNS